jgi:DNA-binding NarL/FixJ family response regulator
VVDACFPIAATQSLVSVIRSTCPETRIVALVQEVGAASAFPLLRVGVKGLLTFAESRVQLRDAVATVAGGGYWVPRALLWAFLDGLMELAVPARLPGSPLSPREVEVLEPLLRSLSNKEIAEGLNISERTVKFHVSNLLEKFAVQRRGDLIRQSRFWERAS